VDRGQCMERKSVRRNEAGRATYLKDNRAEPSGAKAPIEKQRFGTVQSKPRRVGMRRLLDWLGRACSDDCRILIQASSS
jgi:hypothetical protein